MESSVLEDLACAGLTGGGRGLVVGGLHGTAVRAQGL